MSLLLRAWIVCVGVACTGVALAAPRPGPRENYKLAAQLDDSGDAEQALVVIDQGLAIAPKDLALLGLKGTVLLKLRDYAGALAAYQAYLEAGAAGANRREAQKIVANLLAVRSTFLEVALAGGAAAIYLDSRTQGVFCVAAPACSKAVLPGEYKVIAEQAGFERWTGRVVVDGGKTARIAITLVEKPSLVTVRTSLPGARIAVDDQGYEAPVTVAAGKYRVTASLAGYQDARLEITAHDGLPVEVDVPLTPVAPIPAIAASSPPAPRAASIAPAGGSRWTTRKLAGIAVAAGGGVALGVGVVFGAKARATYRDVRALCGADLVCDTRSDFDRGHQLVEDARSQATTATLLIAAGGVAVAAGAVIWLTAPAERRPEAARIAPIVNGRDVGLAVVGGF